MTASTPSTPLTYEKPSLKIADAVSRIASLRAGNYFVFFPSFEFLDRVQALFSPPAGTEVLKQQVMQKAKEEGRELELQA